MTYPPTFSARRECGGEKKGERNKAAGDLGHGKFHEVNCLRCRSRGRREERKGGEVPPKEGFFAKFMPPMISVRGGRKGEKTGGWWKPANFN